MTSAIRKRAQEPAYFAPDERAVNEDGSSPDSLSNAVMGLEMAIDQFGETVDRFGETAERFCDDIDAMCQLFTRPWRATGWRWLFGRKPYVKGRTW